MATSQHPGILWAPILFAQSKMYRTQDCQGKDTVSTNLETEFTQILTEAGVPGDSGALAKRLANCVTAPSQRSQLYNEIMAHGMRSLYSHRDILDRIVDTIPDEELTPRRIRAWMRPLRDCIVEWYEAGMASWFVPDEFLDDFVRRLTQAGWRAAMEDAGYRWDGVGWVKTLKPEVGRIQDGP